jgi:hypothetical protein
MKTIIFKLVSGEEVMGRHEAASIAQLDDTFVIKSPRVLTVQQMQDGRVGASFVPIMLLNGLHDEVEFQKRHVVAFSSSVNLEYENRYIEATSGLTLASSLR